MPKANGKHIERALAAVQVKQINQPGRYADGNGLYLVVAPSGAKRWMLRTIVQGRRRDIGLGGASLVSLAEARELALEYRKLARTGGDPIAAKKKAQLITPTFTKAAEAVHKEQSQGWRNAKHAAQWITTLETYAFPVIGAMPVDKVETPDVLRVLSPIWMDKPETARRLKQRIGTVLNWAKAAGFRTGDNPVDGVASGLPRQRKKEQHHAAMPYGDVPAFVQRLRSGDNADSESTRLAFEFLILTATRTSEVLKAKWNEIDWKAKLWIIPAERMKAHREHRVPLSSRCLELLQRAKILAAGSEFIFPGRAGKTPKSNMVFLQVLKRMSVDVTPHGFRSSFRDWASEATSYPREIAEMALAHTIENKVEAAYRRGDLLVKRSAMMEDWASFMGELHAAPAP